MPNWCSNIIDITIDPVYGREGFDRFVQTLNTPNNKGEVVNFSFHQTFPRPLGEDWYIWNCSNWGTKWDVDYVIMVVAPDLIHLEFDTAWTPPNKWIMKACTHFGIMIENRYAEPGIVLYGNFSASRDGFTDVSREPDEHENDEEEEEEEEEIDLEIIEVAA